MKKAKSELNDWGRPEYKRSELGKLVRGKYFKRLRQATNVVVLEPEVAKAFPTDQAVNKALRSLMSAKRTAPKRAAKSKIKNQTEKTHAA